jgi:topoisomerase-4 subunit B
VAEAIQKRIVAAERERKDLKGIQKIARERARQAKVHNKKLRDCRAHLDSKHKQRLESTLFITEGDSASGSITKSRDVETQAVFSLRGKPLNTFGLAKKIVYENEEFALLQAALGIEDGIEELRYNKVVIATDADVDGMHIRLLLLTFFLQFFPEIIREGHLYILQTPLFRVRNKKETIYCYDDEARVKALAKLGKNAEITRFKGLGEISPDEFKFMIGPDMRLDHVEFEEGKGTKELLAFYMGKNTPDRQDFIIERLRVDVDRQVA